MLRVPSAFFGWTLASCGYPRQCWTWVLGRLHTSVCSSPFSSSQQRQRPVLQKGEIKGIVFCSFWKNRSFIIEFVQTRESLNLTSASYVPDLKELPSLALSSCVNFRATSSLIPVWRQFLPGHWETERLEWGSLKTNLRGQRNYLSKNCWAGILWFV